MTDITVSLPIAKAEKMLPLLQKARLAAKGDERKILTGLLRGIESGLVSRKEMQAYQKMQDQCSDAVNALSKSVLDVLPQLRRRGLTRAVVAYVNSVDKAFQGAQEDYRAAHKAYVATLPRAARDSADLSPELLVKTLSATARKLDRASEKFKSTDDDKVLEASQAYPNAANRLPLAKKCLVTALEQGAGADQWDELDMVAMCFGDMNTHLQLGVAILGGRPAQIDAASNMDTACREGIDEKVWDFVSHAIHVRRQPKRI